MLSEKKLPIAHENDIFTDVVALISEFRLGMAVIVNADNKLSGILTDGDIRRILLKFDEPKSMLIKDLMTKNPKTIKSNDYAATALHLMEKYSITTLAVVDDCNTPIGVVHIHDLMKAGVV